MLTEIVHSNKIPELKPALAHHVINFDQQGEECVVLDNEAGEACNLKFSIIAICPTRQIAVMIAELLNDKEGWIRREYGFRFSVEPRINLCN